MFKYIKWELKSLTKRYTSALIVIAVVFGLMAIIPMEDNIFTNLIAFAYMIIFMLLAFGTFLFGTKKVIDTFRKPTFMLESMISFPPYKILLSKYLLAIILNAVCAVLFTIATSILVYRAASIQAVVEMFSFLLEINNFMDILEVLVMLLVYSTSFTSLVTFSYVLSKSLFPKGKGAILFGILIWYLLTAVMNALLESITGDISSTLVLNLFHLVFTVIFYFCTVKLIENKLEIYN